MKQSPTKPSVVSLEVNGSPAHVMVAPGATLLAALRDGLGLTGTRKGCESGTCGACTVHLDGEATMACLCLVETLDDARVDTIEGLATSPEALHPIQEAFLEKFATQCGFCTAGMIMAAAALLAREPNPSREDVIVAISGNICRCTGYEAIIEAILHAAAVMRRAGVSRAA